MGVSGYLHAPVALLPGKNAGTHQIGVWGAAEPTCMFLKSVLPPLGFEPRTIKTIAQQLKIRLKYVWQRS
jgi:hypothetical protein